MYLFCLGWPPRQLKSRRVLFQSLPGDIRLWFLRPPGRRQAEGPKSRGPGLAPKFFSPFGEVCPFAVDWPIANTLSNIEPIKNCPV